MSRNWRWFAAIVGISTLLLLGAGPTGSTERKDGAAEVAAGAAESGTRDVATKEIGKGTSKGDSEEAGESKGAAETTLLERITYESPVFLGTGEAYAPEETMEQGGKTYRLLSSEVRAARKSGQLTFAAASVPYALEGRKEPPGTAVIQLEDQASGLAFEREVPLLEIIERGTEWSEDFRFSVTVSGYGADVFWLGETEIPGDAELSQYGGELLMYLGLPEEYYRVDEVSWEGEPYEQEGTLYRNATALGEKLIRNVEVRYGGQVRTPDLDGKQYIGIYEEVIPETEPEETEEPEELEATELVLESEPETDHPEPERQTVFEKLLQWLESHLTVIKFGVCFFLGLGGVILLLWLTSKSKNKVDDGSEGE